MPEVSIIIPAWNGEEFLPACLRSLEEHIGGRYELLVIDNGSEDETANIAASAGCARLIRNMCNLGFAGAVNQGLQAASGEILFLLNQDTVTLSDWLTPLQARFSTEPRLGIIGCQLLFPDGRVQHAGAQLIEPYWDSLHLVESDVNTGIDYVTGAALAIRPQCNKELGGFDEGFAPAYSEDVDYCLRARVRGWQIGYAPEAVLRHFGSQSRGDDVAHLANINAQRLRLVMKHRDAYWILGEFCAAEQTRIQESHSVQWLLAMAHAYLRAVNQVLTIAMWRRDFYGDRVAVDQAPVLMARLLALRQYAVARALSVS